jgi:YjbE family integral membrane protein
MRTASLYHGYLTELTGSTQMMLEYLSSTQEFLIPLIQIIGIDIVLSGDNALVIALAARALPPEQQRKAVAWGAAAAITMRIVLTFTAVALLSMPYLKLIGSVFLMWVGIQLLDSDEGESEIEPGRSLATAIRTILFADMVMSLDNVLGVAAAARGSIPLLVIGLGLSIPLVIFGANILLRLMQRFPVIITIGAGLIGYVAGEMAVTDPAIRDWVDLEFHALHQIVPITCAALTIILGNIMVARKTSVA